LLLKKLEAYGFKSFADRLELEFGPGITAVVGPNGSGKSNITEAIRWVLGEQSAKNLRGVRMEDIIFVGSERRKPLGIAEVSLTLDNSSHKLPIDFTEVTITRRVFRSGESEFFINKVPCRLKDIYELFSDTGLGREAFSVIGQNQVDEILNSRPEDRRTVFEEAAGITKFKNRKRESIRRLEETQHNLLRIRDILGELESQLGPLSEASAKAEAYLVCEQRYKQLDTELLVHKTKVLETNLESIQLQYSEYEDKLASLNVQLAKYEVERENAQLDLAKLEDICQGFEDQIQRLNQTCQQLDSSMLLLQEKIKHNQEKQCRLQTEVADNEVKLNNTQQETEREQSQLVDIRARMSEQQQAVAINEQKAMELEYRIKERDAQINHSKDVVMERMQSLGKMRNALHSAQTEAEVAERSLEKLQKEIADNLNLQQNTALLQAGCNEKRARLHAALEQVTAEMQHGNKKFEDFTRKLQQINVTGDMVQQKLNGLISRHHVLSEMQRDFEGYGRGVKTVMSHRSAKWTGNICGVIADLLDVPEVYAQAIEVALGGAVQNIVTEDTHTAKAAIAYLKSTNQGRATFLPIDVMRDNPARDYEITAAKSPGSRGLAVDLVSFDPKYMRVMKSLLGRTIIAENMDAALEIARKSAFRSRIVTLEGDIINPGGSMTGGSRNTKGVNLLGRSRELTELQQSIDTTQTEWELNRQAYAELNQSIKEIGIHIQNLQTQKQQIQIELAGEEKELAQLVQELNRHQKMHQVLILESEGQRSIKVDALTKISNLDSEISAMEHTERDNKATVEVYQAEIEHQRSLYQALMNDITELKIRLASTEQEEVAAGRILERIQQERQVYLADKQNKLQERSDTAADLQALTVELQQLSVSKTDIEVQHEVRSASLQQSKTERYRMLSETTQLDKSIRDIRRKSQELQSKCHDLQLSKARFQFDYENNRQQLFDTYDLNWGIARQTYIIMMDVETAAQELAQCREDMRSMGTVNVAAIEEYKKISERFDFLNKQAVDLEEAQTALRGVITEMDITMRKQFLTAFHAIDREFMTVFGELFGGGFAELQLIDKENVLESGIEIVAQPPGKKLQQLSLLSGGERALTVIALLFSILRVRPTPFCVVDEIDAALDEANVTRFAQFLSNLAKYSQFVVITHRKTTMEYANVMHGITMEEEGVSKLISVKFAEQAS